MNEHYYFVWRRNDGYIDVSILYPQQGWTPGGSPEERAAGIQRPDVTFEQLASFPQDKWIDCYHFIINERMKADTTQPANA